MTILERRLATRVALVWVLANILSSAINIVMRLIAHQRIFVAPTLVADSTVVLEALAGVAIVIYLSRTGERVRIGRFIGFVALLYVAFEVIRQMASLAVAWSMTGHPSRRVALLRAAIDMQYYFILVVGAVGATLVARWHERAVASARQNAAAEAALAEARVRNLRAQVQPGLVRNSLCEIETLLQTDRVAAEAVLLNLSDFLRIALLRARGEAWSTDDETEYDRLSRLVAGARG